jgi:hypothetical protein
MGLQVAAATMISRLLSSLDWWDATKVRFHT